jgi:hypothetical protein
VNEFDEECTTECLACVRRFAWYDGWLWANPDANDEDAEEAFAEFLEGVPGKEVVQ